MILEVASIEIHPGQSSGFEETFDEAIRHLASSPGYYSHELQRSADRQDRYLLLVHWATIDDHMVGFRESPAYQQWRTLLNPYFASKPDVEHYEQIKMGSKS